MTLVLLVICVFSCSDRNGVSNESKASSLDSFITYNIDIQSQAVRIADLVEEVELVKLAETPESLLSYANDLNILNTQMIIKGRRGDILFYNLDGTFSHKINRSGKGPEEYNFIGAFWLDNNLNVYDQEAGRIQQYDLSGNHIGTKKIAYTGENIYPHLEGYVLDRNLQSEDELNYQLLVLDKDLNLIKSLNPFKKDVRSNRIFSYGKPLIPYKDGVIYHRNMSDTVFYLKDTVLTPLVTYDFGADWAWTNESLISNDQSIRAISMENKYVWKTLSQIGEKFIFMQFSGGRKGFRYVLIDRLTSEYKVVDLRKTIDTQYAMRPVKWDTDFLVFNLSSTDVRDFVKELGPEKVRFRAGTTMDEIEASENPALARVKFK